MNQTILIVDDDPTFVAMATKALSESGFHLVSAEDGEKAIVQIKAQEVNLIVLDVAMPRMDGFNFIQELKDLGEKYTAIPIVVVTSKEGMEDIFLSEGVKDYFVKPIEATDLVSAIKKHLVQ